MAKMIISKKGSEAIQLVNTQQAEIEQLKLTKP